MSAHAILLQLMGGVALLLWGTHMVRSGVTGSFGARLRRGLMAATSRPARAAAAGAGAAMLLQSSTATGLLVAGFAGQGLVALAPALAVMLGADLGTTLVVQVLAFDLSGLVPVLLIAGVGLALTARRVVWREAGRIVIGFALMILALGLIVAAALPLQQSELVLMALERLGAEPVLAVILAALLTWLFHSSVAFVLFVMALTAAELIGLPQAVLLVIGANLGAGLVPLGLAAGLPLAGRRVLYGNLGFRALGALAAFAAAPWLTELVGTAAAEPTRQVAHLHLGLNLALLVLALPFAGAMARLVIRLTPDRPDPDVTPDRLDPALIPRPALAVNAATREVIAMAERLQSMLDRAIACFETGDTDEMARLHAEEVRIDRQQEAIKRYLVRLMQSGIDPEQSARVVDLLLFTAHLEHVGDIIDKGLVPMAEKKQRLGLGFSAAGWDDIRRFHGRVADQMRAAMAVLVSRDPDQARLMVAEKDRLRAQEQAAVDAHVMRLAEGLPETIETSALHLDILRDLKWINAHLVTVATPILEREGALRGSRLKSAPPAGAASS